MKDQLVFDVTDATSIADSDSVGAYVRSSDGTLITHSTVGGKEALDVSIADGFNVEVDLDHTDDSVRLGDGTAFFTSTSENSDIALDVHISNTNIEVTQGTSPWVIGDGGGSITVDGTVAATQSGVWDIGTVTTLTGITNDVSIDDGGNSITVDAVQLDIDDLNATDDAVASWTHDGTGTAITSRAEDGGQALDVHITGSGALTVNDAALADTAIANAANTLAVAGTAQDAVASPLADRKYLFVSNQDNKKIFVGSAGVTAANGFPVGPGSVLEMRAGDSIDIEYVGQTGATPEIRTLELS